MIEHSTEPTYKPLKPKSVQDYSGVIDVRFKTDERRRRSTLAFESSTIQSRFNSLGFPSWNTPEPGVKPFHFHSSRLTTCIEKKFDCIPADDCKIYSQRHSSLEFCKWVRNEPYVCCEKPNAKVKNYEFKCGKSKSTEFSQSQAIIGGVDANSGLGYPWMVAIGENADNDSVDWYCGGALIGERTVVTAAHCASRRSADVIRIGEIDLRINVNNTSSNMQQISVIDLLIHPLYRFPLLYNDIALLYLSEPVRFTTFARPICITQKISVSETPIALLTGWGQLSFATDRSPILQEVTVKVFNNSYCDQQYSITQASKRNFPRGILDTQLCAGDENGGKDACQGDSGSPLVTEEDGSLVLIGLVSAGIGCGSKTFPGVYTRISAYSPWILENTL